jgi:hypothetical protein
LGTNRFLIIPKGEGTNSLSPQPSFPSAGSYKTEPYTAIVIVPGHHPDDKMIIVAGPHPDDKMILRNPNPDPPIRSLRPDLRFVPFRPNNTNR